jgi:hypothetical protein
MQEEDRRLSEILAEDRALRDSGNACRTRPTRKTCGPPELAENQRIVFVAHEIDGLSMKHIAERTGVGINTALSRKRYAVLYLRRRLQAIYNELMGD